MKSIMPRYTRYIMLHDLLRWLPCSLHGCLVHSSKLLIYLSIVSLLYLSTSFTVAHAQVQGSRNPAQDITVNSSNAIAHGLWADSNTIYVANRSGGRVFAYTLSTRAFDDDSSFDLTGAHDSDAGVWSDGTTIWVSEASSTISENKVFAYNLSSGTYTAGEDFNTLNAAGNNDPTALWSDGTTMWVADWGDGKIYAYGLANKARIPTRDFDTLTAAGNSRPHGLTAANGIMYVLDSDDLMVYAYRIADKARVPGEEFALSADNATARGIAVVGSTMWVSDANDNRLYAYNLDIAPQSPQAPPFAAPINLFANLHGAMADAIRLSWTAPENSGDNAFTEYVIAWVAIPLDESMEETSGTIRTGDLSTSYIHSGVVAANIYSYTVRAASTSASGSVANVFLRTLAADAAATPTGLTANPGADTVSLSWTAPAGVGASAISGYRIEMSVDSSNTCLGTFFSVGQVENVATTSYTRDNLTSATNYCFRVVALNRDSRLVDVDAGPPSAAIFTTTTGSAGAAQISMLSSQVMAYEGTRSRMVRVEVTVDRPVPGGFTVRVATADDTAMASADYTSIDETLTFAGMRYERQSVLVPITNDNVFEIDKQFTLTLSTPTATTPPSMVSISESQASATVQIKDDDTVVLRFQEDRISVNEDDANIMVAIVRVGASAVDLTVSVDPLIGAGDTAVLADLSDLDTRNITFPAGGNTNQQNVDLDIADDDVPESAERFSLRLSNPRIADEVPNADILSRIIIQDSTSSVVISGDIPRNLSATNANGGSIELGWGPPDDDMGITAYQIQWFIRQQQFLVDSGGRTITVAADARSYTHRVLSNSTRNNTYTYQIRALYPSFMGQFSVISGEARPLVLGTRPSVAQNFVGVAISQSEIQLSWDAPANDLAHLHRYVVFSINDDQQFSVASTQRRHTVTGLVAGTDYQFAVNAVNYSANGNRTGNITVSTLAADVPNAPTALTAAVLDSGRQIRLSWTAPSDVGVGAISGYRIIWSGGGQTDQMINTGNTDASYTHTVPTQGVTYQYTVAAVNATGAGGIAAIGVAAEIPGMVGSIEVNEPGSDNILLSWRAPDEGGGAISGYRISWSGGGQTAQVIDSGNADTNYRHTGLMPGTTYRYRIQAINTAGMGDLSILVGTGTTVSVAVRRPGRVEIIELSELGSNNILLSWRAPDQGGGAVSGYRILWSGGGQTAQVIDTGNADTNYRHTGLMPGTTYSYRIQAINSVGIGNLSTIMGTGSTLSTATPTSLVSAPQDVVVSASSATEISLSWQAPVETGGIAITDYQIEWRVAGSTVATQTLNTGSAEPRYLHSDLTPNTPYRYRIRALTVDGLGAASERSAALLTPSANVADAPMALGVTSVSPTQISLAWSAPLYTDGLTISGYRVQRTILATDSQATFMSDTMTYDDTTVVENTRYRYQITALTAAGESVASSPITVTARAPAMVRILSATETVAEDVGEVSVQVQLDSAWDDAFDVGYIIVASISDDVASASANVDYTAPSSPPLLRFTGTANEIQTITIPIIDDALVEATEAITVLLEPTELPAGVFLDATRLESVISITDNDTAEIIIAAQSFLENSTLASIAFSLSAAVDVETLTATLMLTDITTDSSDYGTVATTVTFRNPSALDALQRRAFLVLPLTDDTETEGNETFSLSVSALRGQGDLTIGTTDTGVITIIDDDNGDSLPNYLLEFSESGQTIAEDAGTMISGEVTIRDAVAGGFSIVLSTEDGSATESSADYSASTVTLTFAGTAGESQGFTIDGPLNDDIVELNETFSLVLTEVTGTTLPVAFGTSSNRHTVTITDNDTASLTLADVSVLEEADAGVIVTLDNAVQPRLAVDVITLISGTDSAEPADFTAFTHTLSFSGAAGEQETALIAINDDIIVEPTDSFTVMLSNLRIAGDDATTLASRITHSDTAQVTIMDNDTAFLRIDDQQLAEGSGSTNIVIDLSAPVEQPSLAVILTLTDISTSASDYSLNSASVNLNLPSSMLASERRASPSFSITADTLVEGDESVRISASVDTTLFENVTIVSASAVITIEDDDAPTVSITPEVSVAEGDGSVTVQVSLDNAVSGGFSIAVSTEDGTATSVADYQSKTETLTFAGTAGETQDFSVMLSADDVAEPTENLRIMLADAVSGTTEIISIRSSDRVATVTITDNTDVAAVTLADVAVDEAAGTATVVATLDNAVQGGFSVTASTVITDANTAERQDFTVVSGHRLSFVGNANESQSLTIPITDDQIAESADTFSIMLSNLAVLIDSDDTLAGRIGISDQGMVTINDNDRTAIIIAPQRFVEGSGIADIQFSLSHPLEAETIVATVMLTDVTTDSSDYGTPPPMIRFTNPSSLAADQRQAVFSIPISIDSVVEGDETFTLSLSVATGQTEAMVDSSGTGTITLLDAIGPNQPVLSIARSSISVEEDNAVNVEIIVSLDGFVAGGFSIMLATVDGTATSPADYTTTTAMLDFIGLAGERRTFSVPLGSDDSMVERPQHFSVQLAGSASKLAGSASSDTAMLPRIGIVNRATVNIIDDDDAVLTLADVEVNEETGTATVVATLDRAVQGGFSVDAMTAVAGSNNAEATDFTALSGQRLNFVGTEGEAQSITITLNNDAMLEMSETFTVWLNNLQFPTLATVDFRNRIDISDTATVTIIDNDMSAIIIEDQAFSEDIGSADIILSLSHPVEAPFIRVSVMLEDGSTSVSDYAPGADAVTFETPHAVDASMRRALYSFAIRDDVIAEADETLMLSLGRVHSTTVLPIDMSDSGVITIIDNEPDASLLSLRLSAGNLSPAFDSDTRIYTAALSNQVERVTVIATAAVGVNFTVQGVAGMNGVVSTAIALAAGDATAIDIVVTAADGTTMSTYQIMATRADAGLSTVAELASLSLSDASISPVFTAETTSYTASVASAVEMTTLSATAISGARISAVTVGGTAHDLNMPVMLAVGDTEIMITVTAADGAMTSVYSIMVTRQVSAVASLSTLRLSSGSLSPTFNSATLRYTTTLPNQIESVAVIATAADGGSFMVQDAAAIDGVASTAIALVTGVATAIEIVVTATDGTTMATYQIMVTRQVSTVADLASLSLSSGNLSPTFTAETTRYTATVGNAVNMLTLSANAISGAQITTSRVAGSAHDLSMPFILAVGETEIIITVTAADGATTRAYRITVTRQVSADAVLSSLSLSSGNLSPMFDSNTFSYTGVVAEQSVSIIASEVLGARAVATVGGSIHDLSQPVPLSENSITEIRITVISADNANTNTYIIRVTVDSTAPMVTIRTLSSFTLGRAFTATFIFSEVVNGFEVGDITVTNGTVAELLRNTTNMMRYTAEITPNDGLGENDEITITVVADAVTDLVGNGNAVAMPVTLGVGVGVSEFDVNGDGMANNSDALAIYYVAELQSALVNSTSLQTTLLQNLRGDATIAVLLSNIQTWLANSNADLNADGTTNSEDALALYYVAELQDTLRDSASLQMTLLNSLRGGITVSELFDRAQAILDDINP